MQPAPRSVTHMEDVNPSGTLVHGKEEAVRPHDQMPDFESEGAVLGGQRTALWPTA